MRVSRVFQAVFQVVVLSTTFGLLSCGGEDEPEQCGWVADGEFQFSVDPPLDPNPDPAADVEQTFFGAVLDSIIVGASFVPPTLTYRFHTSTVSRLDVRLTDLLLDEESDPARRGFPVTKGETYTLTFELTQNLAPPSMALRIIDGQGLRFLGVNDWRPAGTAGAQVQESGYGGLGASGDLKVFFAEAGCGSQDVDPACYQEYTNHRLDFLIGTNGPLSLWSSQSGTLAGWRIRVHKAAKVLAEAGCFEGLLHQNGVSFTVERDGLRTP